jgi:hypothetical protein
MGRHEREEDGKSFGQAQRDDDDVKSRDEYGHKKRVLIFDGHWVLACRLVAKYRIAKNEGEGWSNVVEQKLSC